MQVQSTGAALNFKSRCLTNYMAEDNNSGHGHGDGRGSDHDEKYKIIVNGRDKIVDHKKVSFEEVVRLAFDNPSHDTTMYTVSYRNADQRPPNGTLVAGQTVKVQNGTVFNVTATNKS